MNADDLELTARLLVSAAREGVYQSRRAELTDAEILAASLVAIWALRGGLPDAAAFDAARRLADEFIASCDEPVDTSPAGPAREHGGQYL